MREQILRVVSAIFRAETQANNSITSTESVMMKMREKMWVKELSLRSLGFGLAFGWPTTVLRVERWKT